MTASFRIRLWIARKPHERLMRYVGVADLIDAVVCAEQWISWANAQGRGKLPRYNRYRVEHRAVTGEWETAREGEYNRATMEQPTKDQAAPKKRTVQSPHILGNQGRKLRDGTRQQGRRPSTNRLAQIIQQVKRAT